MNTAIKAQLREHSRILAESVSTENNQAFQLGVMLTIVSDLAEAIPEVMAYIDYLCEPKKEDEAA